MAIRYDSKLNSEINKIVRNFNQKVTRLEKNQQELLPTKISVRELKKSYNNRSDLKRKLRQLKRFSTRGIEQVVETKQGLKISKYDLINLKKENARVKRSLTMEIKRLETTSPKVLGKKQKTTFAQMGDQHYLNLVARRKALEKEIMNLNKSELERLKNLIDKTLKNKAYMNSTFKENYLKMLTDLGYYFDYDNEKLQKLEDKLMDLSPDKFLKLFQEDKSIRAILDYYPVITNTLSGIDPDDLSGDVNSLYDSLIDNLDEVLKDYA